MHKDADKMHVLLSPQTGIRHNIEKQNAYNFHDKLNAKQQLNLH